MTSRKRGIAVAALALLIPLTALAMPAAQFPVPTTQPDGTPLTVRIFGDEWYHFYEDEAGHVILQEADGWWTYAAAALDGDGRYVPTAARVGKDALPPAVRPHLREAPDVQTENRENFFDRTLPSILEQVARDAPPGRVAIQVPVVLTQYTDFFASQTGASFNDMMNLTGYSGTGCFREYYEEVSYGNLTVSATVFGWYTAPQNRVYYRHGAGTITQLNRARELVRNAVDQAESAGGANWSVFDNDLDGNVDVVFIVHQGRGAECGDLNLIWSHHWYLNAGGSNYSVNYDAKLIDRYIIQPEISCGGGHIEIGVFCHEFGHALGMPDLYDTTSASEGVGNWCLMGGGGWGGDGSSPDLPSHLSAWGKIEQGWVTPTVVATDMTGVNIAEVETTPQVFKLWTGGAPANEYFLVENRQETGFDVSLLTGGLAVWHIDEAQRPIANQNVNHKFVDLEEADGLAHLDAKVNRGDTGDLYPGSSVNRFFNGATNPDSDDYALAPTFVCVDNVSNSSSSMTADFCVSPALQPDLMIRDCAGDVGAEPDVACSSNWVQSLDIWIDNNDDGVIDAPIQGVVNHLYVRAWNIGGAATNANVKCWYVNPSLGLNFGLGSPGTQIQDAVTFQTQLAIPTLGPLLPTPGGLGYRAYFNWLIPNPPPNINHYCIGCVIENAADPQISPVPLQENNLGQINYWALALKAGTTPLAPLVPDTTLTIFREQIRVVNSRDQADVFTVAVEGLEPPFFIEPGPEVELFLGPFEERTLIFDIIKEDSHHLDVGQVRFRLLRGPNRELAGGLVNDLLIDSYRPKAPEGWRVSYFTPQGDNYPRPMPTYELTWQAPTSDVLGLPETVRYYEIHAARDSTALLEPNAETLLRITGEDDDLQKPGFQFYYFTDDIDEPVFFVVRATDAADNPGLATPVRRAHAEDLTPAPLPSAPTALLPNLPNPFNPSTSIWFTLDAPQHVRLSVYDVSGRLVADLADEALPAGSHRREWNGRDDGGRDLASGTYVLVLQTVQSTESRKITLVR